MTVASCSFAASAFVLLRVCMLPKGRLVEVVVVVLREDESS
jgi:hypothetical protein